MADNKEEKEIDLLELVRKLLDNRRFIIKVTLIGAVIGLIIAFSIPKEYTTTVVFMTNSNSTQTGNMGALASLAGINLSNMGTSDVFSPELYPNIISSTAFVQGLLDIKVVDKDQEIDTTLYAYFEKHQKKAWWSYVLEVPGLFVSLIKSDQNKEKYNENETNKYYISKEERRIIETLKDSYSIRTDKKTGVTTFEVTSQSSVISAFLVDTITASLQSYIIEERTKKSQKDLENSRKLYKQYKDNYDKSQKRLAEFVDRNKNIVSESYRFSQRKLELEANLAYDVYNQMAQQVQLNEIKVQDDIPVFTIIQPSVEPLYPSSPNKKIILFSWGVLSLIFGVVYVFRKYLWNFLFK